MPGGPAAAGYGIGANAPKNKLAGILMVRPTLFHLPKTASLTTL